MLTIVSDYRQPEMKLKAQKVRAGNRLSLNSGIIRLYTRKEEMYGIFWLLLAG
jgi:hypothetical protein